MAITETIQNSQFTKLSLQEVHAVEKPPHWTEWERKCPNEVSEYFQFQKSQQWSSSLAVWFLCPNFLLRKKSNSNQNSSNSKSMPRIISPSWLKCQNLPPSYCVIEEQSIHMPTFQKKNSNQSWTKKDGAGSTWETEDTIESFSWIQQQSELKIFIRDQIIQLDLKELKSPRLWTKRLLMAGLGILNCQLSPTEKEKLSMTRSAELSRLLNKLLDLNKSTSVMKNSSSKHVLI